MVQMIKVFLKRAMCTYYLLQVFDYFLLRWRIVFEAHGSNQVHEETIAHLPEAGMFLNDLP